MYQFKQAWPSDIKLQVVNKSIFQKFLDKTIPDVYVVEGFFEEKDRLYIASKPFPTIEEAEENLFSIFQAQENCEHEYQRVNNGSIGACSKCKKRYSNMFPSGLKCSQCQAEDVPNFLSINIASEECFMGKCVNFCPRHYTLFILNASKESLQLAYPDISELSMEIILKRRAQLIEDMCTLIPQNEHLDFNDLNFFQQHWRNSINRRIED